MPTLSNLLGTLYQGIQGVQGIQGTQGIQGPNGPTNVGLTANIKTSSYTLAAGDVGELILISSGAITIPQNTFSVGDCFRIYNSSGVAQTVTQGAGTSLYVAGTTSTGNISMAGTSILTVLCVSSNTFVVAGGSSSGSLIQATGGTIIDSGGYRIHVFTSPGSFVVTDAGPGTVEYLVVAGGGGGGGVIGGGGGAGGFRTGTNFPITAQTYPITVGGGGSGGFAWNSSSQRGNPGSESSFGPITSAGGGGGGAHGGADSRVNGTTGGSGGGGGNSTGSSGNIPPTSPPQGNNGGNGDGNNGGGGGGASAAGETRVASVRGGNGGVGSPITWIPASYGTPGPAPGRYFSGGGGGGTRSGHGSGGTGGAGGGGNGGTTDLSTTSTAGTTNTGGGGGAGGHNGNGSGNVQSGSNGGSGIVIIRYQI